MNLAKLSLALVAASLCFAAVAKDVTFPNAKNDATFTVHSTSVRVETNEYGNQQISVWISMNNKRKQTVERSQMAIVGCSDLQGKIGFLNRDESLARESVEPWFNTGTAVRDKIAVEACVMAIEQGIYTQGLDKFETPAPKSRPAKYAL